MTRVLLFVLFAVYRSDSSASVQIVQSFCSGLASLQNEFSEDAWYDAFDYK